jgi:CheY-like chemotaxis protein
VAHMVRLIDDLLDVSRITRGAVTLRRRPVLLNGCIEQAVEQARALVDRQGQMLTVSLSAEAVWVDADPARLVQVLGNLLTNAAKFTPPGGRINLASESRDGEVVIRVHDTGPGIAPERLQQVFELFFQERTTIDRSQGGLGIGLTLVKTLVELHGGRVEAHSAGLGQGAELVVILPCLPVLPLVALQSARPAAASRPLRLLIVEDNVDAAVSFRQLLELGGHTVRMAHDGLAGLEVARSYTPDVAFIDIGLPGIDGYQLARRLRDMPSFTATTLVALSGYGRDDDKLRAAEAGFDRHFTKPVDTEAVDTLLADIAGGMPFVGDPARAPEEAAPRRV